MYSFTLTFAVEGPQTSHHTNRAQKKNYKFLRYIPINVAKTTTLQSAQPSEADNKWPIYQTVTPNTAEDNVFHQSCRQLSQHESTVPLISQGDTNEKATFTSPPESTKTSRGKVIASVRTA
jgi:hypothetical protein